MPDARTGVPRAIKSRALRAFEKEAMLAIPKKAKVPERVPLKLWLVFYMPDNRRRDSSNLVKAAEDAISRALGFDDSRIVEHHIYKEVDRGNPRAEARLIW